jgi:hypothetical protein
MATKKGILRRLAVVICIGAHSILSANASVSDSRVHSNSPEHIRSLVVQEALKWVGHREIRPNWSPEIEKWLASCTPPIRFPAAWCAAWLAAMYREHCVDNPNNAWVDAWTGGRWRVLVVYDRSRGDRWQDLKLLPGDACTIFNARLNRQAHIWININSDDEHSITVEGNTNNNGSREGDGVYKRKRHKSSIFRVLRLVRS